ncbi:MAG: aldo/keto reductase, partial [Lentisphaeria bacterium]|nr:aldo/keto reductase [Lentisphaeria bacterium]NQZ68277.1 aldo/keto reductase [Lentisphaeria bacterium]
DLEQVINETIPTLQKIKETGKVRFVGITGLPLAVFRKVIDRVPAGSIDSILSYCHYSLNDSSLESYFDYFEERGIGIINASPTGMGLLVDRAAPEWHPAPEEIIDTCKKAVAHCKSKGQDIVELAMQYAVAETRITTTLTSTANPENIIKNINYIEKPMDTELLAEVLEILEPIHNLSWPSGLAENS